MAITTVRQMLTDAQTLLVALETNPDLTSAEQNSCTACAAECAATLADLNAQSIITNAGKRNAHVTNLHDQCLVPIVTVDRAHGGSDEQNIYNAVNRIEDARALIAAQVGSDDVTY